MKKIFVNTSLILAFLLMLAFGLSGTLPARAAGTCYVNDDAGGANNGTSWADAYTDLQSALADSCIEIWVAAGVYNPGTLQTDTFQLVDGLSIYGGFAGDEILLPQRHGAASILSGDIDNNDTNVDENDIAETTADIQGNNSYHVVTGVTGATLDGFTITAGNANSSYPHSLGGGMYNVSSNPTVTNMTFSGNSADWYGGGMFNSNSSPTLANVAFSGNSATSRGGGMENYDNSNPALTNITFSKNTAQFGGGVSNYNSTPSLWGITFTENSANEGGGGMSNDQSDPTLTQITFNKNSASFSGGGMHNDQSSPTLTQVTFTENSAGDSGGGVYNTDNSNPMLINVTFSKNLAAVGAGMYNKESGPTLTNTTFTNNSANSLGGGVANLDNSSPTFTNITFSDNSATLGGGLYSENSNPILKNVIIANSTSGGDCVQAVGGGLDASSSNNLIEDSANACALTNGVDGNIIGLDPLLGTLGDHGSLTETISILPDSPALNTGNDADCPADDQRGETRPQGEHCDIGAYEAYIPTNDLRSSPKTISGFGKKDEVNTSYTTASDDDPSLDSCGITGSGVGTVWYEYTADSNTAIAIDTFGSGYDTFIAVWLNDELLACNDNTGDGAQSQVAIQVKDGITYTIEIGKPIE